MRPDRGVSFTVAHLPPGYSACVHGRPSPLQQAIKPVAVRRVCIPVPAPIPARERQHAPAILVAVSDADLRAVATRVLNDAGYRVLTARHSGHALLASLTSGRIDVLLTDLRMDEGCGRALAARLRRYHPDLRAVYFSNDTRDASGDVVISPATADDLLQAVAANPRRA